TGGKSHQFWKNQVKDGITPVELLVDFSENKESKQGAAYRFMIEKETTEGIREMAEKNNTSVFVILFSVYIIMLSRFSGRQQIACSLIAAGRDHISLKEIIGFFVNSLLYNTHVDVDESFEKWIQKVHAGIMEVFQHQTYPLEPVFDELNMRYPEIPVSFNMLNLIDASGEAEAGEAEPSHSGDVQDVKFDLEPYVSELTNGISMDWRFKKQLFKPQTIEKMADEYKKLIRFFTTDPQKKIKEFTRKSKKRSFKRRT
ncbi:MAG: hypothetical protein GY757_29610, partial [bacterium]|nr:hypothetical protein [bacterium]